VSTLSFFGAASDYVNITVSGTADGGVAYHGGNGRDIVHSGKGNDTVDGGGGLDTAVYTGNGANYTVARTGTGIAVSGALGQDTLTNVERVEFGDKGIAFDSDGTLGQAFRLYNAVFDRVPDAVGLGFWMSKLDQGVPARAVAEAFASSPEFKALYGGNTSAEVVAKLYLNILDRPGDAEGAAFWGGVLDRHEATMGELLLGFSQSDENVARMVGLMQNGVEYMPYGG
jgi:Ca2+-binding RTX toxin-like protein